MIFLFRKVVRPFSFISKLFAVLGVAAIIHASSCLGASSQSSEIVKYTSKMQEQRALGDKFFIWGNTSLWLGVGMGSEFNDNIELKSEGKKKDIILKPNVFFSIEKKITESNTLDISGQIGKTYYLKNSENNTRLITVSPDSALIYTIQAHKVKILIAEALSIQEDATSSPTLNNIVVYRRLTNSFSITPQWDINPYWTTSFSLGHSMLKPLGGKFKDQDRTTYSFLYKVDYQPTIGFSIGPAIAFSKTVYTKKIQNDSTGRTLGVNVFYRFSEYLESMAFVGVERTKFKPSGTIISEQSSTSGISYSASIKHRLTPYAQHTLRFEGGDHLGFGTDSYTDRKYTYSFDTQMNTYTKVVAATFFQTLKESGSLGESASRFALLLNFNFAIMRNTSLATGYRFLKKSSDKAERSFKENKVTFDITYIF